MNICDVFLFVGMTGVIPDKIRDKIPRTENLITDEFQSEEFIVIDADEDCAVIGKQFLQEAQSRVHHASRCVGSKGPV